MDGHVFKLVKENITLNSVPFIYLTAKKEENQMRKYLNQEPMIILQNHLKKRTTRNYKVKT
jgi:hypothetical protein